MITTRMAARRLLKSHFPDLHIVITQHLRMASDPFTDRTPNLAWRAVGKPSPIALWNDPVQVGLAHPDGTIDWNWEPTL